MLEILSYDFFRNALIAWSIVSLISWTLGSLVVLRREANITHAIANILFLWIIVSLFFSANYYLFGIIFAIIWVIFLTFLEKHTLTSRESGKEIVSQIWLAGWIFLVGILQNLQIDVFNFLFWNILFVDIQDIYLLVWMLLAWVILFVFFGKNLLRVILSPEIAKSQWINTSLYDLWYLLYLAVFIALSMKIFWVLLLWAFLVLPGNIGKIHSPSLKWVFISATLYSIVSVIIGLFVSYFADTSAGATIVLILWWIFLFHAVFGKHTFRSLWYIFLWIFLIYISTLFIQDFFASKNHDTNIMQNIIEEVERDYSDVTIREHDHDHDDHE